MALTEQQIRDIISTNLQTGSKITAIKHKEVENSIVDAIFELRADFEDTSMLYEVKELDVPSTEFASFLNTNFDSGKGRAGTKFEKWAICNGFNNTRNRGGRVAIGYSTSYAVGDTGGYEDAVLIAHSHDYITANSDGSATGNLNDHPDGPLETRQTSIAGAGETGIGKNMQPYIVTLFIQRIAV